MTRFDMFSRSVGNLLLAIRERNAFCNQCEFFARPICFEAVGDTSSCRKDREIPRGEEAGNFSRCKGSIEV